MSKKVSGLQQNQITKGFDFGFSLTTFEQVIGRNFKHILDILLDNQKQINSIKQQMSKQKEPVWVETKEYINAQFNFTKENNKNQVKPQTIQTKTQKNTEKQEIKQQSVIKQQVTNTQGIVQTDIFLPKQDHMRFKKEIQIIEKKTNTQGIVQTTIFLPKEDHMPLKKEIQMIEKKTFELFERVRNLEEKQLITSRQNSNNIRQLEFGLMNINKLIEKIQAEQQQYSEQIQKLRNELTEYKLKKQTKLNKMLHTTSLQQSSLGDNESYQYVAQKIQFLLKHVKELQSKKVFQEERDNLSLNIQNQRKKLNEFINESYFHQTIKNTELKIYQTVAKFIKAHQFQNKQKKNQENQQGDQTDSNVQNQLDAIIAEGNRQLNQKVNLQQQNIKNLTQKLQLLDSEIELNRKSKSKLQEITLKQNKMFEDAQKHLFLKIEMVQRSVADVKVSVGQKHLEAQNQIIDMQQNIEKLNSHIKTYNFAKQDMSGNYSTMKANPQRFNEKREEDKLESNPETEDAIAQKKKISKMIAKVQGLKEDLLTMRQNFMRQIDALKANLEKKADWESLKKGLNYFDQKIKQSKSIIQHLYQVTQGNQSGESLAVKKGWTCLMCDRDIKNYQGKVGELKFTSVFPTRQASPRIGGYYKQQQVNQQYKQVFLNERTYNRNKRIGSLKANQTNQSREDLNP